MAFIFFLLLSLLSCTKTENPEKSESIVLSGVSRVGQANLSLLKRMKRSMENDSLQIENDSVCNQESSFACHCRDCSERVKTHPCCINDTFSHRQIRQGILLTFQTANRSMDTSFELQLKSGILKAVNRFCQNKADVCGVNSGLSNNITAATFHLTETVPNPKDNVVHLEVGLLVVLPIVHTNVDKVGVNAVNVSAISNRKVIQAGTLVQLLQEEQEHLEAYLKVSITSVVLWDNVAVTKYPLPLGWVVVGSICGILFLFTCFASAVKAVRDRRRIKDKILAKEIKHKQLIEAGDAEEPTSPKGSQTTDKATNGHQINGVVKNKAKTNGAKHAMHVVIATVHDKSINNSEEIKNGHVNQFNLKNTNQGYENGDTQKKCGENDLNVDSEKSSVGSLNGENSCSSVGKYDSNHESKVDPVQNDQVDYNDANHEGFANDTEDGNDSGKFEPDGECNYNAVLNNEAASELNRDSSCNADLLSLSLKSALQSDAKGSGTFENCQGVGLDAHSCVQTGSISDSKLQRQYSCDDGHDTVTMDTDSPNVLYNKGSHSDEFIQVALLSEGSRSGSLAGLDNSAFEEKQTFHENHTFKEKSA